MLILPVMDLKAGRAVHAVRGDRSRYRPVEIPKSASIDDARCTPASTPGAPLALLQFYRGLGLSALYLADLDALAGVSPNWNCIHQVECEVEELWMDLGLQPDGEPYLPQRSGRRSKSSSQRRVIVPLEALASLDRLPDLFRAIADHCQPVFSLDLRGGVPSGFDQSPLEIAHSAWAAGFRQMIVLDVSGVGTGNGARHLPLLKEIAGAWPGIYLVSGGGVSSLDDARQLFESGCRGILLGTSLLRAQLRMRELEQIQRW